MKVLFIVDNLRFGGAQQVVYSLATGYRRRGLCDVEVCCLGSEAPVAESLRAAGVTVSSLDYVFPRPGLRRSLSKVLKGSGPDIVHTHLELSNAVGAAVGRKMGVSVVRHDHSGTGNNFSFAYLTRRKVSEKLFGGGTRVIAISEAVAGFNTHGVGLHPGRVAVVPNGVDPGLFADEGPTPERRSLGIGAADPVVGFVGRLHKQKGVDKLLAAARLVTSSLPGAKFIVVGEGPERTRLQRSARELGLETNVFFVGYQADKAAWYRLFDVVAQPSVFEPFGLVAIESMASAKPIVAFAVDGLEEVIVDKLTGLLVPSGNVSMLAEALVSVLKDRHAAAAMGRAGRERVRDRFTEERMIADCFRIYESELENV